MEGCDLNSYCLEMEKLCDEFVWFFMYLYFYINYFLKIIVRKYIICVM